MQYRPENANPQDGWWRVSFKFGRCFLASLSMWTSLLESLLLMSPYCSKFLETSERHAWWGEAFGTVCFLWIFHRARQDLDVVLGFRHPWEHSDNHDHAGAETADVLTQNFDKFSSKAMQQREDDDEEEDDDE